MSAQNGEYCLRGSEKTRDGVILLRYLIKVPESGLPIRAAKFMRSLADGYEGYLKNTLAPSIAAEYDASQDRGKRLHFPAAEVIAEHDTVRFGDFVGVTLDIVQTRGEAAVSFIRRCYNFHKSEGVLVPDATLIGKRRRRASGEAFVQLCPDGARLRINNFTPPVGNARLRRHDLEKFIQDVIL